MLISVIITTYNRPEALALVLEGLSQQNAGDFEVLVADDGSTDETKNLIDQQRWPFSLTHVWHEDQGFRAARIRNCAVSRAKGEYLIFIDGDCVPRSEFISSHRSLAEANRFVSGRRLLLNPTLTEAAVNGGKKILSWSLWQWFLARLKGECNRLLPLLPLAMPASSAYAHQWQGAKTCNLAMWRQDFLRVGGFDERYVGWGYEDSDLVIRLLRAAVLRKPAKNAATVLHLWHQENDRQHQSENWDRLMNTQAGEN